jgi:hypothetical protein
MSPDSKWLDGGIGRNVSAIVSASASLPAAAGLSLELDCVEAASARGYFLPDEEEIVRASYAGYLGVRVALLESLAELGAAAGNAVRDWRTRLPVFATAFAAACVLMRGNRFITNLAAERPVLWKKLDEADPLTGVPRKSFTMLYRAATSPANLARFIAAADFYFTHRGEIRLLADDPELAPVIALLEAEEATIERRRRDAVRRHVSYRWFSLLRRHRSALRQVMFGFFEISGRAIAELRQPGVKPRGAPKGVTGEMRAELLPLLREGDVFVTRHEDALSNLFLPGFWPHAALYLGERPQLPLPSGGGPEGGWFLEARKDGVLVRPAAETLEVDAFVVVRPPLDGDALALCLARASSHAGKPFDFMFDFRAAERLACTEVIYRGMHGIGPVRFQLREVGGRLCLPAELLLDQALGCGFTVVAAGGLGGGVLAGAPAEAAFLATRPGRSAR